MKNSFDNDDPRPYQPPPSASRAVARVVDETLIRFIIINAIFFALTVFVLLTVIPGFSEMSQEFGTELTFLSMAVFFAANHWLIFVSVLLVITCLSVAIFSALAKESSRYANPWRYFVFISWACLNAVLIAAPLLALNSIATSL